MADHVIGFSGDKVGLIVRGKTSEDHTPGKMQQHADCAASNGAPVGYFGEGGEGSGYLSSAVLFGIKGDVYYLDDFKKYRPHYVSATSARANGVISTILIVPVSNGEATKFDEYWSSLNDDPGTFSLLGRNCSTRASGAFRHAGILTGGIPGLDTPNNLYKQLKAERPDKVRSYSGYIGFEARGNGFSVRVADV